MTELTLDEIKKSELETMEIFRDFCESNNLKYFLTFGTLLGAVRHKGFIPWDDDVDIFMPRDDYDYLIAHFNESSVKGRRVISKEIYPDFYLDFAKIVDGNTVVIEKGRTMEIGVWIDIFPLDYLKDNKSLIIMENIPIGIATTMLKYTGLKPLKRRPAYKNLIIRLINALLPSRQWFLSMRRKHLDRILSKEKTNTYGLTYQNMGIYGVLYSSKALFEPPVKMEFEGRLFDAPREYKKILKCYYGKNYMQPPPPEKRVSNHSYVCYWRERL